MLTIEIVREDTHDLNTIVEDMNSSDWEDEGIDHEFTFGNVESFVTNPDNYFLIAKMGGEIAAMLVAYKLTKLDVRESEFFIYELETKAKFRRQGIARKLLHTIRDIALKTGAHEVWVPAETENAAANQLYSSLGIRTEITHSTIYNYPLD